MAHSYCQGGCCDLRNKEEKNSDKLLMLGVYALSLAAVTAIFFYANSHGIYIDPSLLP